MHSTSTPSLLIPDAKPLEDQHWEVDLGGIHLVFGDGVLEKIGEHARGLGIQRPLVVTDPGIRAVGHVDDALASLRAGNPEISIAVFDGVEENPTTEHVGRGVDAARAHQADGLIGLGGGSSMDCCKGINFLYTGGGKMEDYWGADHATQPMLPSIGVPTTAGTGSEGQRFALISQAETHVKMACGDRKARFRTVLLDPHLISSMPRQVAAVTGMDAVSHALESYVTRRRNPISQLFAREAWHLLEGSFETFLADPSDRAARARMLLGAHFSGAAIEASMLGAAHSCANPLTARYGVIHGVAVGLMLPYVIRFNAVEVSGLYQELAETSGVALSSNSLSSLSGEGSREPRAAAQALSLRVCELGRAAGLPERLRDCGVESSQLDILAEEAKTQWTAQFNPRSVEKSDFLALYESAF